MPPAANRLVPDYLVLGHLSLDSPAEPSLGSGAASGPRLGGTAAFAALTARALGLQPAILTSTGRDLDLTPLEGVAVRSLPAPQSTSFRNAQQDGRRVQHLLGRARDLVADEIPTEWRTAPILHLAPIAGEVDPSIVEALPKDSLLGVTPQGWVRRWERDGRVRYAAWEPARRAIEAAQATVVSLEDLEGAEDEVEALAAVASILVVTEGPAGARVYWHGDVRRLPAPQAEPIDDTGAGDIFAAAFFVRLHQTRDPWESARFANRLAAASVTRRGVAGVPTPEEALQASMVWTP